MSTTAVVAIVVAVLVVAAVVAAVTLKRGAGPGSGRLKHRFGPEYERTLAQHDGDEKAARQELAERVKRYGELDLQPLSAQDKEQFEGRWATVKAQFVDHPAEAVTEADRLIGQLAEKRGFPAPASPEHTDALSVHHPHQLQGYRRAHALAGGTGASGSKATEELRQALLEARGMFDELMGGAADTTRATDTTRTDDTSRAVDTADTTGRAPSTVAGTTDTTAGGREDVPEGDLRHDQDGSADEADADSGRTRRSPLGGRFAALSGSGRKDDTDSTH